jgi:hypothetical protein
MIFGAFSHKHYAAPFLIAGLLISAVAAGLGWHSGSAIASAAEGTTPPTSWNLPQEHASNTNQEAELLRTRRPWGGGASFRDIDSGPPPSTNQPWTLVGTIVRNDERFALIRTGPGPSDKFDYRSVGDSLPDGSSIEAIEIDTVTTTGGPTGRKMIYRLFQTK